MRVPGPLKSRSPRKFGIADRGRPGDKMADGDGALGVAHEDRDATFEIDLRMRLWTAAEDEAVRIFGSNLRDLLLAAPPARARHDGPRPGLPDRREGGGCGCDRQGRKATTAAFRTSRSAAGRKASWRSRRCCQVKHNVDLIAIGNGTASRETDRLPPIS